MLQFFDAPRFNTEIRYGTVGGPEFSTDVGTVTSGAEYRNSNWLDSRGAWQVGTDLMNKSQMDWLNGFFRLVRGRAGGFRFKDWSDFKAVAASNERTDHPPTGGFIQIAPGVLQMVRLYYSWNHITYKIITKPVDGTVTLHGVSGTIDYSKGQLAGTGGVDPTTFDGLTFSTAMFWEGEFDVPARFDTDKLEASFEGYRDEDGESLFSVSGLTIVELRPDV